MRKFESVVGMTLVAAMAATGAFAGAYLESANSEPGSKAAPELNKLWFEGGKMRSENGSKGGGTSTAIFKNKALYILDNGSKTYRIIDKATVDQMAVKLGEARKKMEAQMATMPPERRAMMEKMLGQMGAGGAGAPKRVLKNTGRTETVGGIKCAVWEATEGGKKAEELCAAAPGAVPGGDDMLKTLREVGEMFKGFSQNLNAGNKAENAWRDLETINGVPIMTRQFEEGKVTSENRLNVARKESVPASTFEIPAGYTEKKLSFGPGAGE
jgi:hypothetical protein